MPAIRPGRPVTQLALICTWLGHVNPRDTYWYLSASPELMALARDRLEQALGGRA